MLNDRLLPLTRSSVQCRISVPIWSTASKIVEVLKFVEQRGLYNEAQNP